MSAPDCAELKLDRHLAVGVLCDIHNREIILRKCIALQDFGLIVHPPMLYMGYVGFSVAFAFAIAALLSGRMDAAWARWARPWTNIAWAFLGMGITLGSWWAYYELGWGGRYLINLKKRQKWLKARSSF
jgi:hypothetical protein